ncbi:unnamed protein product, partial [Owenia fusiformis]
MASRSTSPENSPVGDSGSIQSPPASGEETVKKVHITDDDVSMDIPASQTTGAIAKDSGVNTMIDTQVSSDPHPILNPAISLPDTIKWSEPTTSYETISGARPKNAKFDDVRTKLTFGESKRESPFEQFKSNLPIPRNDQYFGNQFPDPIQTEEVTPSRPRLRRQGRIYVPPHAQYDQRDPQIRLNQPPQSFEHQQFAPSRFSTGSYAPPWDYADMYGP